MKLKENKPYTNVVYNFDITYVVFAMSVAKKKSISFLRLVSLFFLKKIMFQIFDLIFYSLQTWSSRASNPVNK